MILIGAGTEPQVNSLMTSLQPYIQSFCSQFTPPHQLPPLRCTSLALQIIKNKLWWEFMYVWNCLFFWQMILKHEMCFQLKMYRFSMSLLWKNILLFWKNGNDQVTYIMFDTGKVCGSVHHSLSGKVKRFLCTRSTNFKYQAGPSKKKKIESGDSEHYVL